MRPELRAVVEDAYEIFGAYRIRHALTVCHCDCCMTEENEQFFLIDEPRLQELVFDAIHLP